MNNQFFLWFAVIAPCHEEKDYLLRENSYFLRLGSEDLVYLVQYCMFILLVNIIGLDFVIVFNFHRFKSFDLCLYGLYGLILVLFCLYGLILPKNGRFFLLSTFEASASVGHSFLSFLKSLFVEGLCELCWLLLLLRKRLSLFSFFLC